MEFYRCERCGQIIVYINKTACNAFCCGQEMVKIEPNTTDAALEKHVPVVEQEGNIVTVKVGSVAHPMTEAHYITTIALETKNGLQIKQLTPTDEPCAVFALTDGDEVVAAYENCNLHGFWKK